MEIPQQSENTFQLSIHEEAKQELKTLSIWAKIVAITAFVSYGLNLLIAIIGKTSDAVELSGGASRVGTVIGAIIAIAIGVPLNMYLYNFARSTLASLQSSDANHLEEGFYNLRGYFKFLGVLMIIILVCAGLVVVFGVLGALIGRVGR